MKKSRGGLGIWSPPDANVGGPVSEEYHMRMAQGDNRRPSGQPIQMRLADQVKNTGLYPPQANYTKEATELRGQLNPDWEEWLMGWPVGWTSLKPMPKERFEAWKKAVLDDVYWDIDPADLPPDHDDYVPRLTKENDFRNNRIEAIGNGQVPQCIYWMEGLLMEEEEK